MADTSSSSGREWTDDQVQELRELAEGNTPSGVMSMKLGRSEDATVQGAVRGDQPVGAESVAVRRHELSSRRSLVPWPGSGGAGSATGPTFRSITGSARTATLGSRSDR